MTKRFLSITDAMLQNTITRLFKFGYFGSGIGAAVAVRAVAQKDDRITAITFLASRLDLVDLNSLRDLDHLC